MESRLLKLLICSLFPFVSFQSFAQDISGIWRGYFITESGENYRLEFQINLNGSKAKAKSRSSNGVSYSYLDVRFYGKATMTGFYNIADKTLQIQELKTVEVRNMGGGSTCIMNYKLQFAQSGKEEFLEGTYIGKQENVKLAQWGDCGGGKVFLRRVTTSDFYVEPFLKNKIKEKATDSAIVKNEIRTPIRKPAPVKKTPTAPLAKNRRPPVQNKTLERKTTINNNRTDTTRTPNLTIITPQKTVVKPVVIPQQTRSRENSLIKTIDIGSEEVTIKIYDNGEVDDDTVSVYLDNKLIIANKRISEKPITYTFKINVDEPEHIVTMVAENMGRIPPNTSLMIVNEGDKRHEVFISTNEQKNAVIRFRYKRKED